MVLRSGRSHHDTRTVICGAADPPEVRKRYPDGTAIDNRSSFVAVRTASTVIGSGVPIRSVCAPRTTRSADERERRTVLVGLLARQRLGLHRAFCGRGGAPVTARDRAVCYVRGMPVVETCRLPVDGGGAVFCEVTGDGQPLVLTHDAIVHRETWDAQFEPLSRWYRMVRWDRRGYGRSDEPDAHYASDEDLARVIDSLTEPPAILMGCSNGGLLSLQCALKHPNLVAALVLVGPIVSVLGITEHYTSRGGRRPGGDLTAAGEIEYWTSTDLLWTAPANTGARDRLRALLTANPNNLQPKNTWNGHLSLSYWHYWVR